jgi:catechol 2,3-dioxygenase-like lactoylglutathione lyase family enzyme
MIQGAHIMLYTPQADELRAFICDKLGFPFTDVGGGWLVFELPGADLGCHPADKPDQQLSFYCDDIQQTMAELEARGVTFTAGLSEQNWGLMTRFQMPGEMEAELYQPKYVKGTTGPGEGGVHWQEFAAAAPDLGAFGLRRLEGRVAYLATARADGAPRVHPVSPFIGQGRLFVYMEPSSPKAHDLRRDDRYALHGSVEDSGGGEGELSLSGRARLVTDAQGRALAFEAARAAGFSPKERYVMFALSIERALATTYVGDDIKRMRWPDRKAGSTRD